MICQISSQIEGHDGGSPWITMDHDGFIRGWSMVIPSSCIREGVGRLFAPEASFCQRVRSVDLDLPKIHSG
jgi:hypothetical protein